MKKVKLFTLFHNIEQNNVFLGLINFSDGSEGSFPVSDGLCQNLRQYSKVAMDKRSCTIPPLSFEPDFIIYIAHLK